MSYPPDMSPTEVHAACHALQTALEERIAELEKQITSQTFYANLANDRLIVIEQLTARVAELEKVIKDFSCEMAISYSEPRLRYYELQVACSAYDDFKAFAAALKPKEK